MCQDEISSRRKNQPGADPSLSEEELTDIDMMQWSMDIDERLKRQDKELLSSGILTEEDFV